MGNGYGRWNETSAITISHQPSAISDSAWWASLSPLADLQTGEAGHRQRRAQRLLGRRDHVFDAGLAGGVADRVLVRQDGLLEIASELAFDDLLEHVGRLARVLHLRP